MISFKQLTYALAVSKTLHFKKAAEQCHISQSALSTALNELEKHLSLQIFERDNKKVLVTPMGEEVLVRARSILTEVDQLMYFSESQQKPLAAPITLGIIPTIAPYLLPKLLPRLLAQYPYAKLNIVEEQSHILVERVRSGELDTAILALPYPIEGLLGLEFWQEDFYWICLNQDRHHHQSSISSEDLEHSQLMLLKDGHCLKDQILDVCKLSEKNNHGFSASSLSTIVQLVAIGIGTTLVPEMALEQLVKPNQSLRSLHLNEPGPHREIAFLIRPNYTRMACIDILKKLSKQGLRDSKNQMK